MDTNEQHEYNAWAEVKAMIAAIPPEMQADFWFGDASERDEICDKCGIARESWWLLGVLRIDPTDE